MRPSVAWPHYAETEMTTTRSDVQGRSRIQRRGRAQRRRRRRLRMYAIATAVVLVAVGGAAALVLGNSQDSAANDQSSSTSTSTTIPETTTTSPETYGVYSRLIREENAKGGTANWRLTNGGAAGDIEGYANVTSAQQGDTVTLRVSTIAPTFIVEAYRMGWYWGLGGRLIWASGPTPGRVQAAATWIGATNTAVAPWDPSITLALDKTWVPGAYLLKLVASTGQQRWVPLTIRDDASPAAYVVMNAVTTWQAYNRWGGCSLYACTARGRDRAKMVSFDRPYDIVSGGASDFIGNELALIMRVEELGLDVTYMTNVDLQQQPQRLAQHKVLVSLGHDEYWSKQMFDAAIAGRDGGLNMMFLGANAVYRQIRFEPSSIGPDRHIVNYRATPDPIRRTDPAQTTVSFRDAPVNRPEAELIGQQYECNPVRADLVVNDPGGWVWEGTGMTQGQHLEIVVGSEYDRFDPGDGGPKNVQIFAHSPVDCRGRASYADVTYYTAPSGAGVFATGTNYWVSKLEPPEFPRSPYNPVILAVTKNVLLAFGEGPAAAKHPSISNWQNLPGL